MIFLPRIELSERIDAVDARLRFMLGDSVYFLYVEDWRSSAKWKMLAMNAKTYELSTVNVYGDIASDELWRICDSVVVHNDKAYMWSKHRTSYLCEGTAESDGFKWRKVETTGNAPPKMGVTFGYSDGNTTYYCNVYHREERTYTLHQLNLNTLTWVDGITLTTINDKDICDKFKVNALENKRWNSFVTDQTIHFFTTDARTASIEPYTDRAHVILDLQTLTWSLDRAYNENPELPSPREAVIFTDAQDIWMIGSHHIVNCKYAVFRYDMDAMTWTEMRRISIDDDNRYIVNDCATMVGTRVLFMSAHFPQSCWSYRRLVHVLELRPSLFERAAFLINKNLRLKKLARTLLPSLIVEQLIEKNLLTVGKEEEAEAVAGGNQEQAPFRSFWKSIRNEDAIAPKRRRMN